MKSQATITNNNTSQTPDTSDNELNGNLFIQPYSQVTASSKQIITNPRISKLPECIELILSDSFSLHQIHADRACFIQAVTLAMFQTGDPQILAKFINKSMIEHQDLFFSDHNRTYLTELIYGPVKVFVATISTVTAMPIYAAASVAKISNKC